MKLLRAAKCQRANDGIRLQQEIAREEDIRHDIYRPAVANRLSAGTDEFGRIRTLYHQIV